MNLHVCLNVHACVFNNSQDKAPCNRHEWGLGLFEFFIGRRPFFFQQRIPIHSTPNMRSSQIIYPENIEVEQGRGESQETVNHEIFVFFLFLSSSFISHEIFLRAT